MTGLGKSFDLSRGMIGKDFLQRLFSQLARRAPADAGGIARIGRHHIYILPTRAGVLFAGVVTLMLLGSLNYQNNLGLLFSFLFASIAIVGMHHTWFNLLDLTVSARGVSPVFAGQEASFSLSVSDAGSRRHPDLRISAGRRNQAPFHLSSGDQGSVEISVATGPRGRFALESIRVETRYPLGLFKAWCYPQTDAWVTVYPRPAIRSPDPRLVPVHDRSHQGDLGEGSDDLVGPRDYRSGDSPRRLDWKALARGRGLVVKQFGGDKVAQVWIDLDRLVDGDTEARLGLLCRQVLDAADNGLSYGLRLPGVSVPLGHGQIHKHRCLEALADYEHA